MSHNREERGKKEKDAASLLLYIFTLSAFLSLCVWHAAYQREKKRSCSCGALLQLFRNLSTNFTLHTHIADPWGLRAAVVYGVLPQSGGALRR